MCSVLVSSCTFHFFSWASVRKKKKESEQEGDSSRFNTLSGNHDEPQGKFWSSASQTQLLTWLHKAFYEAVIMERGVAGIATWDPAALPSSLSAPPVAPRDERADVNQWHVIVAASL